MTDWIKKAAQDAKQRHVDADRERDRVIGDRRAIQVEAPRIWSDIRKGLEDAINEFNAEAADNTVSPLPVYWNPINSDHVTLGVSFCRPGRTPTSLTVIYASERDAIECTYNDEDDQLGAAWPPESLYFRAFKDGSVALTEGSVPLSSGEVVKMLTLPIFSRVRLRE